MDIIPLILTHAGALGAGLVLGACAFSVRCGPWRVGAGEPMQPPAPYPVTSVRQLPAPVMPPPGMAGVQVQPAMVMPAPLAYPYGYGVPMAPAASLPAAPAGVVLTAEEVAHLERYRAWVAGQESPKEVER
ncbi:hypothetical protein GCM10010156_76470 [Planobispora rosea]|uniref:Uncharacterized protein n=1 Tax=Planobispora rosea TaxID=35762 RepID=A0A8J3SB29_PLARO|nr:hypothetical protein [Planobispora rosea]GGT08097.1 hypothetical protein GCM10010156_76470 [Planobispora rosea]GIH89316.1 hypothetical protein Pro02_77240 [Planobispora rosea]